ncbi:CpsD/CapB family tyrosine-protein kinase [Galactobacillus timonensis]|uniref:CpsD/CapB family tyrosine-protein kinase n=1 Tax=Galactobacillus timonensis TaxID=2041840 RepID=UPI0014367C9A|nr:CpsD/CapB family tyrosine-protein kinase [Galactobacillus timonensis]
MNKKKKRTPRKLMLVTNEKAPFNYREAYKSLRTNLKFIAATENAKSFVITSALQTESKSNVSTNLAITLAEEGKSVVLVDCDFRKPTIHRFLHMHSEGFGITDVLMDTCPIEKAIYHQEDWGIYVLPVGTVPPNPAELISTPKMKSVLDSLKKAFDYVIIDTPPVSVVTDATIVGGIADGVLLVVRSDFAPVEMVQLAKKKLEDVNVKIFGIILTRFDAKRTGHQSGYYYSYNDYYYSYDKDKKE